MPEKIHQITLPNELVIDFFDCTSRYFGDIHRVKLEIICKVPILRRHCENDEAWREARSLLGKEVDYRRVEERMGVPSSEITRVLDLLMSNFREHSYPYFSSIQFPRKLILAEVVKIKKKKGRMHYP